VIEAFSVLAGKYPSLQLGILGAGMPAERVTRIFRVPSFENCCAPASFAFDCAEVLLITMFFSAQFR